MGEIGPGIVETGIPAIQVTSGGERALRMKGITAPVAEKQNTPKSVENVNREELIDKAFNMLADRELMRRDYSRREPTIEGHTTSLTHEDRMKAILDGNVDVAQNSLGPSASHEFKNALGRKINEINAELNALFASDASLYNDMVTRMNQEIGVRKQAREVRRLNNFMMEVMRLKREAQTFKEGVERPSAEVLKTTVDQYNELIHASQERSKKLLEDPAVKARYETLTQMKTREQERMKAKSEAAVAQNIPNPEASKAVMESRVTPEKAKEILGDAYIGIDGLKRLNEICTQNGIDMQFDINEADIEPNPFTQEQIKEAKSKGRVLIYRPRKVRIGDQMLNFSDSAAFTRFLNESPIHNGLSNLLVYSNTEALPLANGDIEKKGGYESGWIMVTAEPIIGTLGKTYQQQDQAIAQLNAEEIKNGNVTTHVRRRTSPEALMDYTLAAAMGKSLLIDAADWTSSVDIFAPSGTAMAVGFSGAKGKEQRLDIESLAKDVSHTNVGICPQWS